MKSFLRLLALVFVAAPLGACATYDMIKAPPAQSAPMAVAYSNEGLSAWDGPLGTYTLPNSNVTISGHQSGNGLVGALFGPAGMLLQGAAQSSAGKSSLGGVAGTLQVDITGQIREATEKLLASGKYSQTFTATPAAGAPVLTLRPFVVLTYANDTDIRVWVIAAVTVKSGKAEWSTRYFANVGKALPLTGPDSLTANDGALYKTQISQAVERLASAALDDFATRRPRDEKNATPIEFDLPYTHAWRNKLPAVVLSEDEQTVVVVPKMPDTTFWAGVYILDKSQITRP
jgi:hypothetical protein